MHVIETEPIVRLLLADALPTLGERARTEVERLVRNYEALALEWMAGGESPAEAQCSFERAVVDGLQQTAHDLYWDTTWPTCPRHSRHPLWYDEHQHAWRCKEADVTIAPLGGLVKCDPPARAAE